MTQTDYTLRRFAGVARSYGDAGLARLMRAHICVLGIGGVGSWVVESLARTAVGSITMVDMDVVVESNINRQLPALEQELGRDKCRVMQDRIAQINKQCKVQIVDDYLSEHNVAQILDGEFDFIIDCIDDFRVKAALIAHCRGKNQALLTIGGAGGQCLPEKICLADLSNTEHDVLLARTRKLLRQDYAFPTNLKRRFGVPAVYSKEQLYYPDGRGGITRQKPVVSDQQGSSALSCAGGLGSLAHVTASFGFFASSVVLNKIAH